MKIRKQKNNTVEHLSLTPPDSQLYLKQIPIGPMDNFVYLAGDRKKKECTIVDPAWDVRAVFETARRDGMKITCALETHTHFDHSNGLEDFMRLSSGKIYVHKNEARFLEGTGDRLAVSEDGFELQIGEVRILFIHTPGHTPGALCYWVDGRYLISGDTLFVNACGRCDLPGSDPRAMYASLQKLTALPEHVILLPGHDYGDTPSSTIGDEKRSNPYCRCGSLDDFLACRMD